MTHYYTDNTNLLSDRKKFEYTFDNEKFNFFTDNGVFSKDGVDYASYLLIKCVYKQVGKHILDLGCGYGVIGIILSRFNPLSCVDLVDVNSRAINLAITNGELNRVSINVYNTDDISTLKKQYDSIILNPPIRAGKSVIFGLYDKAYDTLLENGNLFIVIQKKHGANSSLIKLKELFKQVEILDKINGHWLIKATK